MDTDNLTRRLNRLIQQRDEKLKEHKGNEMKLTYWAGYNLGYIKGKIDEIEEILEL